LAFDDVGNQILPPRILPALDDLLLLAHEASAFAVTGVEYADTEVVAHRINDDTGRFAGFVALHGNEFGEALAAVDIKPEQ
jgi:hypothetical protein